MRVIKTKTTFLQMFHPPAKALPEPRHDLQISRLDSPSLQFYRHLHQSVGSEFYWVDRALLPEHQLRAIIHDDRVDVFVLHVAGETAGYSELDRRREGEIELAYFGLFRQYVGQRLGKHLLNWTLRKAWSHHPKRVWVHTCDLDHVAALPNYLAAGLQIYDEQIIDQVVPD